MAKHLRAHEVIHANNPESSHSHQKKVRIHTFPVQVTRTAAGRALRKLRSRTVKHPTDGVERLTENMSSVGNMSAATLEQAASEIVASIARMTTTCGMAAECGPGRHSLETQLRAVNEQRYLALGNMKGSIASRKATASVRGLQTSEVHIYLTSAAYESSPDHEYRTREGSPLYFWHDRCVAAWISWGQVFDRFHCVVGENPPIHAYLMSMCKELPATGAAVTGSVRHELHCPVFGAGQV